MPINNEADLMPKSQGGFDLNSLMQLGLSEMRYNRGIERENALRSAGIMTQTLEKLRGSPDEYDAYLNTIKTNPTLSEVFSSLKVPLATLERPQLTTEQRVKSLANEQTVEGLAKIQSTANIGEQGKNDIIRLNKTESETKADIAEQTEQSEARRVISKNRTDAMILTQSEKLLEEAQKVKTRLELANVIDENRKKIEDIEQERLLKTFGTKAGIEANKQLMMKPAYLVNKDGKVSRTTMTKDGIIPVTAGYALQNNLNYVDEETGQKVEQAQTDCDAMKSVMDASYNRDPSKFQELAWIDLQSNQGAFGKITSPQDAITRLLKSYITSSSLSEERKNKTVYEKALADIYVFGKEKTLRSPSGKEIKITPDDALKMLSSSKDQNGMPSPFFYAAALSSKDPVTFDKTATGEPKPASKPFNNGNSVIKSAMEQLDKDIPNLTLPTTSYGINRRP